MSVLPLRVLLSATAKSNSCGAMTSLARPSTSCNVIDLGSPAVEQWRGRQISTVPYLSAGLVAPQTAHDRALLFHKSPGQMTPFFCPTLVTKAAGKQIHERNHPHPLDNPIPNDTESSPKTFRNQNHTTTKKVCTC